jgi:hypothetical protein
MTIDRAPVIDYLRVQVRMTVILMKEVGGDREAVGAVLHVIIVIVGSSPLEVHPVFG